MNHRASTGGHSIDDDTLTVQISPSKRGRNIDNHSRMDPSLDGDSAILWSDNPENAYFAYMVEKERNQRLAQGMDADSLLGMSTREEMLYGNSIGYYTSKGLEDYTLATEEKDTIVGNEKNESPIESLPDQSPLPGDKKNHGTEKAKKRERYEKKTGNAHAEPFIPPVIYVASPPPSQIQKKKKSKDIDATELKNPADGNESTEIHEDRNWKVCRIILILAMLFVLLCSVLVTALIVQQRSFGDNVTSASQALDPTTTISITTSPKDEIMVSSSSSGIITNDPTNYPVSEATPSGSPVHSSEQSTFLRTRAPMMGLLQAEPTFSPSPNVPLFFGYYVQNSASSTEQPISTTQPTSAVIPVNSFSSANAIPDPPAMKPTAEESTNEPTEMLTSESSAHASTRFTESPTDVPATVEIFSTRRPTNEPSNGPTTREPTYKPTRGLPKTEESTLEPEQENTIELTQVIKDQPTEGPTMEPSNRPTRRPTRKPTKQPTEQPVESTIEPTLRPTDITQTFEGLKNLILSISPASFERLQDPDSHQYMALQWLFSDPNLSTYSDERTVQRWALATFFTGADYFDLEENNQFLTETNECNWIENWRSRACDENGNLVKIDLEGYDLEGTFPLEISLLSNLKRIYMTRNNFIGTLPTELGRLTKLERLDVSRCDFSGSIPSEFGRLTRLRVLGLGRNDIHGTIPSVLGDLRQMIFLGLERNDLRGTIPTELGKLTDIEYFGLDWNRLSGTIPREFENLLVLQDFFFARNRLTSGSSELSICSLPNLDTVAGDCEDVECPCCTICCIDGSSCFSNEAT